MKRRLSRSATLGWARLGSAGVWPDGVAPLATTFRRVGAEGWVA